jgi:hypothetical protein
VALDGGQLVALYGGLGVALDVALEGKLRVPGGMKR